jgi:hypothetical protein
LILRHAGKVMQTKRPHEEGRVYQGRE